MISVKCASELGEGCRRKISEIFIDGFGQYLTFFSKDPKRLAQAVEHMFNLDVFYVAFVEGEIVGITACTNGEGTSVKLIRKELKRHLGFVKGTMAYLFLKPEFEKKPIESGEQLASVDFVATASKFRGSGVATTILEHLFTLPQYNQYILEVADTNMNAVKLYEKLGYKEFKRIKHKHSKRSGINYLVYMKYDKPP
jgi:ribosomal protein S18 acetylase RimI-like enzyme